MRTSVLKPRCKNNKRGTRKGDYPEDFNVFWDKRKVVDYPSRKATAFAVWARMKNEVDKLENIVLAIETHGCFTGDCPHDSIAQCGDAIYKIPELISEMRKEKRK